MEVGNIEDLRLFELISRYKIVDFSGNSRTDFDASHSSLLATLEKYSSIQHTEELRLLLIPIEEPLTSVSGEGWDQPDAYNNAKAPDRFPKGSILLKGRLNEPLKIVERF